MYKGQRKGVFRDGHGTFNLSTGESSYEGDWVKGLSNGKGRLRFGLKTGSKLYNEGSLEGEYENGFKQGTSIIQWDDKSEFHGQFEGNKLIFGTLLWYDSDDKLNRYLGLFKDFQMTGKGSLYQGSQKKNFDDLK